MVRRLELPVILLNEFGSYRRETNEEASALNA